MRVKNLLIASALCALVIPSAAMAVGPAGGTVPHLDCATISTANTTVDIVASQTATGNLWGYMCRWTNPTTGAEVKLGFTIGGTTTNITLDPTTPFPEDGAGDTFTLWVPSDLRFSSQTFHVTANNTNLGTDAITCCVSWAAD